METITRINGNGQPYTLDLPKIVITDYINPTALNHIKENTGLEFKKNRQGTLEAQPETSGQIAALFLTYNFKTRYSNNWQNKNTLFLKSDHHVGFDVDSICLDCCKHNRIHTSDNFTSTDRMSC